MVKMLVQISEVRVSSLIQGLLMLVSVAKDLTYHLFSPHDIWIIRGSIKPLSQQSLT